MFVLRKKCPSTVKILTKAGKPKEYRRERLPHLRKKKETEHCEPRMQESRMDCPTDVLSQLRDCDYFLSAGEYDKV